MKKKNLLMSNLSVKNNSSKVQSSWLIPSDMSGLRVDQYLVRRIGRISRTRVSRLIVNGDFLLDNQPVKLSMRVKAGQKATLTRFAPDETKDILDFAVNIIYQDDDLLVINKPPGLSIHPSANCLYRTLTYWLRTTFPGERINPCHRIDKETSGLVVAAKNRVTEAQVKKLFMKGCVQKSYVAVVEGELHGSHSLIMPLALQGDRGLVAIRMIEDSQGKSAHTNIRSVFYDHERNFSLLICQPKTGRQHQIRAHLALIKHPIIGDKLYQHGEQFFDRWCQRLADEDELLHPRHALHARSLRFYLGTRKYRFTAPLPEDFYRLLKSKPNPRA